MILMNMTLLLPMFIWDDEGKRIVGAYRVGKGKDIMLDIGIRGLYHSLFRITGRFYPILSKFLNLPILSHRITKNATTIPSMERILYFFREKSGITGISGSGKYQQRFLLFFQRIDNKIYKGTLLQ